MKLNPTSSNSGGWLAAGVISSTWSGKELRDMSNHFSMIPWTLQDAVAEKARTASGERVDAIAIAIYAALQRHTDFGKETGARVSDATVAKYAGCDVRTVQRRRRVLCELGFISWTAAPGRTNRYTVKSLVPASTRQGGANQGAPGQPVSGGGQTVGGTTDSQSDNQEPTPRAITYPPEFEECWAVYPERYGGNSKKAAHAKWKATLKRTETSHERLTEAAQHYSAHCDSEGATGTRYVRQAATFFGPDEHWRDYLGQPRNARPDDLYLREVDW